MNKGINYSNQAVIEKYSTENNLALETGKVHFKFLLKFLRTCATSKYPCYPNQLLDEVWHTFILFTKDYYEFCNKYLGKFIHHQPLGENTEIKKGYFCYINSSNGKWTKRLVKNRQAIMNCGNDGNCSSCSSGNDGNCSN